MATEPKAATRPGVEPKPLADNVVGVQMDPGSLRREGTTHVQTPPTGEAIGTSNIGGDNPSYAVTDHAAELAAAEADLRAAQRRLEILVQHFADRRHRDDHEAELADARKRLAAVEKAAGAS